MEIAESPSSKDEANSKVPSVEPRLRLQRSSSKSGITWIEVPDCDEKVKLDLKGGVV